MDRGRSLYRVLDILLVALVTAILVAGVVSAPSAPAQVLKGSTVASPQWGGFQIERLTHELTLNEAQQAKLRPLLEEERREMAEIHRRTADRIRRELNNDQRKEFDRTYGR